MFKVDTNWNSSNANNIVNKDIFVNFNSKNAKKKKNPKRKAEDNNSKSIDKTQNESKRFKAEPTETSSNSPKPKGSIFKKNKVIKQNLEDHNSIGGLKKPNFNASFPKNSKNMILKKLKDVQRNESLNNKGKKSKSQTKSLRILERKQLKRQKNKFIENDSKDISKQEEDIINSEFNDKKDLSTEQPTKRKSKKVLKAKDSSISKNPSKFSIKKDKIKKLFEKKTMEEIPTVESEDEIPSNLPANLKQLYEKSLKRIESGKFRYMNESLASSTGSELENHPLKQNIEDFKDYHKGFQEQVEKWQVNPVDVIIKNLKSKKENLVIADFGCGEAKIAQSFPTRTVHSFDLFALNKLVTESEMTRVPLKKNSVDFAVYCISLMATNVSDHIVEAYRVLKKGGTLIIAEVENRFQRINDFLNSMKSHGFILKQKKQIPTMFILMEFKKTDKAQKRTLPRITLLPCIYKKR